MIAGRCRSLILLVLLVVLVPGAGCSGTGSPPDTRPGARGEVVALQPDGDLRFLVVGDGEAAEYDQAWVTVDDETDFFDAAGGESDSGTISEGSVVEVWFAGPVAESYPVQGTASDVRIVSP